MTDLKVEYRNIKELIPYCNNSRTHSDDQVLQIASSIKEFGFTNPVLIDGQGGIIAGHGRIMAAQKLKMDEVPTITLSGLSDAQKKAYIIADNKLALNSGWDDELLKIELEQLKELDFDLGLIGFSDDELALLMGGETTEGLVDEDQVPELVDDPVTVLGDVWLLGNHRLMCGDSTSIDAVERLMDGQKADMVFTDPPYGYKYQSNHQSQHDMLKNDDKILDFLPICHAFMENNSAIYVCTSHQVVDKWKPLVEENFKYKNMIIWKKNNWSMGDLKGSFAGQHEIILFAHKGSVTLEGKRDSDIWEFNRVAPDLHPTMKPVELVEYAISKVMCNRVLDLFMGSGTTLIASEKSNRACYGMEFDEKYCDVIIKRWQDFTGKQATLESNGKTYNELLNDNQAQNPH